MRRQVGCARTPEYCEEIPRGIVDKLDKGSADGVGMDQGPYVRTGDIPKLAEGPVVGTGDDPEVDKGPADGVGLHDRPSNVMSK